jgi:peptidyl-prolyl cis-trans isomerase A (cyclophilin A)
MKLRIMPAALAASLLILLSGCSKPPETAKKEEAVAPEPPKQEPPAPEPAKPEPPKQEPAEPKPAAKKAPSAPGKAPDLFKVRFETSKGPFVIEVHKDWAPIGAQRFYELVKTGFYNDARFFRVLPNFVVQFGLAASPGVTKKWDQKLKDDPVLQTNRAGSVVFATAGPNTRTTQVFINLRDNSPTHDKEPFVPFGRVTRGMDVVKRIQSSSARGQSLTPSIEIRSIVRTK